MQSLSRFLDLENPVRARALSALFTAWIPRRRWFRSKAKALASVVVEAHAPLGPDDGPHFLILKTVFADGAFERYSLPLTWMDPDKAPDLPEAAVIGSVATEDGEKILCDASWSPAFRAALLELLEGTRTVFWENGQGLLRSVPALSEPAPAPSHISGASNLLGAEQSNTAFAYAAGKFIKLYRRLEETINPEPETLRFLREHTGYRHVPRFDASLEWSAEGHIPVTVALMQELVKTRGDAWEYTLEQLRAPGAPTLEFRAWVSALGRRVAELHAALGSAPDVPDFAPEPLTHGDLERVRSGARALLAEAFQNLERRKPEGNNPSEAWIQKVLGGRARLEALLESSARAEGAPERALKIRTHGDLHLGQILVGQDAADTWILDFEGEPGRPMAEARRKQSPLRDAAGMLRSFHYAAHTILRESALSHAPLANADADSLAKMLGDAFWAGYTAIAGPAFESPEFLRLLDLFVLEKAVYELHYELNNRPAWMEIPLRGLAELLAKRP